MTFINFSPKVAVYEAFSSLKYLSLHPNILKAEFNLQMQQNSD